MLRKNTFFALNWIFFFVGFFFYSLRREKSIFSNHLWLLVKNFVYIVEFHVKLEPQRINIVDKVTRSGATTIYF